MSTLEKILKFPLVPVFYHDDFEVCKSVVEACYNGGIRVFEFTNRGANALKNFEGIVAFAKEKYPEMVMGIGTIYDAEAAMEFIEVGAQFVVQPFTTASVGEICKKNNVAWVPGAMTVTEIQNAILLGAEIVKIFPANVLGSNYVKALRGPLPHVKLMATGGVEPTNESLSEWFGAGINAVGLGSQLFKNVKDSEKITQLLKTLQ